MSADSGIPSCYGVEWDVRCCFGCVFFTDCYEASEKSRRSAFDGRQERGERTYTRSQLASHVRRMRDKAGCTFPEIARAMCLDVTQARQLYREASQ